MTGRVPWRFLHPDASHTEAATGKSRAGTEALTAGLAGFGAMYQLANQILAAPIA